MKIWLDDLRLPPAIDWLWARDKDDFVGLIDKFGIPDEISFDHDLGCKHDFNGVSNYIDNTLVVTNKVVGYKYLENKLSTPKKTGYDCAKWLVEKCLDESLSLPLYKVHSANPVGKENIEKLLENYALEASNTTTK